MKLSDIQSIAKKQPDNINAFNAKAYRIQEYESLPEINVVDSAFPIDWARSVREHFGVRNIGDWAWAYGDEHPHGIPVPCCKRSLAYFDSMFGTDCNLIYNGNYQTDESTKIIS